MSSLQFPEEQLNLRTNISFYEYFRPRPNSQPETRFRDLIVLPLPESLPDNYSVRLNQTDWGMFNSNMWSMGESMMDAIGDGRETGEKLRGALSYAAAIAPGISDTRMGRLAQSELGVVKNPHTTTIFDGVNHRPHSLNFRLSPKNVREAQTISDIIYRMRNYMLPEKDFGEYALNYPYLVTVEFVGIDHIITPIFFSFMQSLTPSYSGGGGTSFYKDGKPVEVQLSFNLQELNIVTRDVFTGITGGRTEGDIRANDIRRLSGSNAGPNSGGGI